MSSCLSVEAFVQKFS